MDTLKKRIWAVMMKMGCPAHLFGQRDELYITIDVSFVISDVEGQLNKTDDELRALVKYKFVDRCSTILEEL